MRHAIRNTLTLSVLSVYSALALLGQGLHNFAADDAHHPVSSQIEYVSRSNLPLAVSDQDGCCTARAVVFADDVFADEHDCEICEFLAQAISQPPSIAAPLNWHEVVTDLPHSTPQFHVAFVVGMHAPRGPPSVCIGSLAIAA